MAKLLAIAVLAALLCGCGSQENPQPASAPAPTPEPTFWQGDEDVEEEYHQPPKPARGGIGDTITLTGSNIGVRLRVTVTGVEQGVGPGGRYAAVKLRLRNTGIAVFESEVRSAAVRFADGRRSRAAVGVSAPCSNGFAGLVRLDVDDRTEGCVLFRAADGARPRALRMALETLPVEEGGLWRLD